MSYTDAPDAQARMGEFLEPLRRHDILCESFHLSSGYTSIGPRRYVFHWNREKFPDPAGFAARFAEAGVRLSPTSSPACCATIRPSRRRAEQGLLIADADGRPAWEQFWDGVGAYLDFTNPGPPPGGARRPSRGAAGARHRRHLERQQRVSRSRARAALAHGFGRPFPARRDQAAADASDDARLARGAGGARAGQAALPGQPRRRARACSAMPRPGPATTPRPGRR